MARKTVFILSIISILNYTTGCTTSSLITAPNDGITVPADSVSSSPPNKILQTTLVDGTILVYNHDGGRYRDRYQGQDSVVIGITGEGALIVTPLKEVESVQVEGRAPRTAEPASMTFLGWAGIAVGVAFTVTFFWLMSRFDPN